MKKKPFNQLSDAPERSGSRVNVKRILISFFIAVGVLVFAFLAGYMVSFLNYQRISDIQDTLKTDLLGTQLAGEFLQNCNEQAFYVFSESLDRSGSLISVLEERFGKNDETVLKQKEQYTLLEVQHFLSVKEYSQSCQKNIGTILFFYSNNNPDEAERIGKILDRVKTNEEEGVMVYSIDYDLDMSIISLMKDLYGVSTPNTLVINEDFVLPQVRNIGEIELRLEQGGVVNEDVIVIN